MIGSSPSNDPWTARPISMTLLKAHFEILLAMAEAGETFIITRRDRPIAFLQPECSWQHTPMTETT